MSDIRLFATALLCLLSTAPQAADWQYLTTPGDTLIGIGKAYLKNPNDWPKVQAENKVDIPKHLPSNTHLRIPVSLLKVTPAPVEVTAVTGNVRVKTLEGGFQPLKAGDKLSGGESVLTGPRSSASYRFADGTALTQQASGKLTFGRLAGYGKTGMVSTEISLESGRLEASAGKQIAPAGGFRVRTPVAVAGLRGTEFRLNVSEDGKHMSNEVTEGAVAVSAQRQSVSVAAGFGTVTEAGKPPAAPRSLLPAPDLTPLPALLSRLPLQFSWANQGNTVAWRAQIATDADFRAVVLDDVFKTPAANWLDGLADGNYFLRVRAVDASGLEGFASTHAFTLDARPLPPQPISPALGERLYEVQANLRWSAVPDAQGYVLQLAPTPEFGPGLIEQRLPPVIQHQEVLSEGEWHWRVASLDETGKPHLFSPHRAFRIQPLPVAPAGAKSQAMEGQAHFAWGPVQGADRYGLEVAQEADKKQNVVVNTHAKDASAATALQPGKYLWRVRGVEADGQAGSWSPHSVVILPPATPTSLSVESQQQPITLAWQGRAPRYRVEISQDAAFKVVLHRLQSTQAKATLPDLPPGNYWVRVIAVGEENAESLPSVAKAFTLERQAPWWLLLLPLLAVF